MAAVAALFLMVVAACSPPNTEAAGEVYEACHLPDAEVSLLEHQRDQVIISVTGEQAQALGSFNTDDFSDLESLDTDGVMIGLTLIMLSDCIIEETGFPGVTDQLRDGDEWDGWSYSDEGGAGSTVRMVFTATG
ncbi:MAG TPA: hypothetical protein VK095_16715 [Beutenbergiaceae bacterium]|nr:hypothetical protein [Beutenbergiaceae bacterium]